MKVVHVVPAITEEASGPSYLVVRLCEELIRLGCDVTLAALDWKPGFYYPSFVKPFPLGFGPRRLGRSPAMKHWIMAQASQGKIDIIHNHSLWMMPNVYPAWVRRRSDARLMVAPHGAVTPWALRYHAFRKKILWWLLQRETFERADAFHATAESEYDDIRRLGYQQPVCVLPSGIDIPPLAKESSSQRRTLLYLGRIHKKKGIDLLLQAWAALESCFPDWDLVIAGPDDGWYLTEYQTLARQLRLARVSFPGALYGADKLAAYRQASLYVLPTHSENFGMTVAEALAAGTPAIVTKGAPWSGLIAQDAGWWIEIGVDPLVAALQEALSLPQERLQAMGANGRMWMERDFSWSAIARQMADFYAWLLGRGPRPACVLMN